MASMTSWGHGLATRGRLAQRRQRRIGQRRLRLPPVSGDDCEPAARPQHARELWDRRRGIEPVEGLADSVADSRIGATGGGGKAHARLVGEDHDLDAVAELELHLDALDVGADGGFLDEQLGGDLPV
jgi:hypothetical protein